MSNVPSNRKNKGSAGVKSPISSPKAAVKSPKSSPKESGGVIVRSPKQSPKPSPKGSPKGSAELKTKAKFDPRTEELFRQFKQYEVLCGHRCIHIIYYIYTCLPLFFFAHVPTIKQYEAYMSVSV